MDLRERAQQLAPDHEPRFVFQHEAEGWIDGYVEGAEALLAVLREHRPTFGQTHYSSPTAGAPGHHTDTVLCSCGWKVEVDENAGFPGWLAHIEEEAQHE